MRIDMIPVGDNPPESLNVIIEVPTGGEPVKYEFDKASGALFVDRILPTTDHDLDHAREAVIVCEVLRAGSEPLIKLGGTRMEAKNVEKLAVGVSAFSRLRNIAGDRGPIAVGLADQAVEPR